MKSTKGHFRLEEGEYLVAERLFDEHEYKIFVDGKEVSDKVIGIIMVNE